MNQAATVAAPEISGRQRCRPITLAAAQSEVDRAAVFIGALIGCISGQSPSEFKVTVVNKSRFKIDELIVDRCKQLVSKVTAQFDASGECSLEEAEGWRRVASRLDRDIQGAIADARLEAAMARPEIGQQFSAWRFNYDDHPTGTVVSDDGNKVTIEVPERIIAARAEQIMPARAEQIIPSFTFEAEWDDEHERWIDWSDKDETDE